MHPIYFIVYENLYGDGNLSVYGLPRQILAVVECDVTDIDAVWQRHVGPLQAQGRHVQAFYLSREPGSFLRERLGAEDKGSDH